MFGGETVNKSKQIVRVEQQSAKKRVSTQDVKQRNTIIAIGVAALLFVTMCALVFYDHLYKHPVFRVGNEKFYLTDVEVMYNVYMQEVSTEQDAKSMMAYLGWTDPNTYWNTTGVINTARDTAVNNAVSYYVMYNKAVENNVSLTEDEKKEVTDEFSGIYDKMSETRKKRLGFSKDEFVDYALKVKLATKYMESLKEGFAITQDKLDKEYKKEDFDERKVEVIYVPISKSDSEGSAVPLDDETKAKYMTQMEAYLKEAQDGKELSKILAEDEKTFSYRELSYVINNTTLDKELIDGSKMLKDGEIASKVIQSANYYYIVKMVDDNPEDAYNTAVSEAIDKKETTLLNEEIEKVKEEYKVKINSKGVEAIDFGKVAVFPGDDLIEFNNSSDDDKEDSSASATPTPTSSPDPTTSPDPTASPDATATPEPTKVAE